MSNCKNVCRLCDRLIISTAVNYDAATNAVLINIPARAYNNGEKYCIVIAQSIPVTATIGSLVFITIEGSATRYPLVDSCCQQVTVCQIRTRTKYSTVLRTNTVSTVFKLLTQLGCCAVNNIRSIPAVATAAATAVTTSDIAVPEVQNDLTAQEAASVESGKTVSKTVTTRTVLKAE